VPDSVVANRPIFFSVAFRALEYVAFRLSVVKSVSLSTCATFHRAGPSIFFSQARERETSAHVCSISEEHDFCLHSPELYLIVANSQIYLLPAPKANFKTLIRL
jgi:hypothetical protein